MRNYAFLLSLLIVFCMGLGAHAEPQGEYQSEWIRIFDSETGETLTVQAPLWHSTDFALPTGNLAAATDATLLDHDGDNSGTFTITAATDGVATVTNGGSDNNATELFTDTIFRPSSMASMEARIRVTTATGALNVGFTDANESAGSIAVELSGSDPTITSNATDCAVIVFDFDATGSNIYALAVDSNTDGTIIDTGVDWAINTWMILRVDVESDGDCAMWIDGYQVARFDAGISTDVALGAYIGLINRIGAAQSADIDYVRFWQGRP